MDDEELEEFADLWGVEPEEVEALYDAIGEDFEFESLTGPELDDYINDLRDALSEDGWDVDVSDLYDMYYGYTPNAD